MKNGQTIAQFLNVKDFPFEIKADLIEKDGEYSLENLVFKLLRRNKYIEKLLNLRKKTYDKQFK